MVGMMETNFDIVRNEWGMQWTMIVGHFQNLSTNHLELIAQAHNKHGRVCIGIRVQQNLVDHPTCDGNWGCGTYVADGWSKPFDEVRSNLFDNLILMGYEHMTDFIIIQLPNIIEMVYTDQHGYNITQSDIECKL